MRTLGILLLTVGAVLTFAIRVDLRGVNLEAIGIIFMVAGGLSILLGSTERLRLRSRGRIDESRSPHETERHPIT